MAAGLCAFLRARAGHIGAATAGHILALVVAGIIFALSGHTIDDWVVLCIKDVPYIVAKSAGIASYAISMMFFLAAAWVLYNHSMKGRKLTLPRLLTYFLLVGGVFVTTTGMTLFQSTCDSMIDRPEDAAAINGSFNITGHSSDSEHCPYVQLWARDLGGDGSWIFLDEVIAQMNGKWGSLYIKSAQFKGPEIDIRAVGWRTAFGNDRSNPPSSYLARARGVTVTLGD